MLMVTRHYEVVVGQQVRKPDTYRKIQADMLQYAKSRSWNVTAGFYNVAQLIYIDESRAVFAFSAVGLIGIAGVPDRLEVTEAMQYVLGYPLIVQILERTAPAARQYHEAAKGNIELARIVPVQRHRRRYSRCASSAKTGATTATAGTYAAEVGSTASGYRGCNAVGTAAESANGNAGPVGPDEWRG